jgi:hypothetical protein
MPARGCANVLRQLAGNAHLRKVLAREEVDLDPADVRNSAIAARGSSGNTRVGRRRLYTLPLDSTEIDVGGIDD